MSVEKTIPHPDSAVRERLLAAALQQFTSHGFSATSVREIVAAAGVTKPTLYYYFGNKEGIYRAIMDGALGPFEVMLDELIKAPGSARQRIIRICTGAFASSRANLDVVRLIYAIYYGPPQGAPHYDFDQVFSRILNAIAAAVTDGIAAGEFRNYPVRELSWGIMGMLNTTMEEQVCQEVPRIDGQGLENIITIFLNGISQGEPK
jgi:TetR/AcrR family transcriptional regulator